MAPKEAVGIALILVGCAVPIILVAVVYIIKKRLEHKQILAAIEKGISLSELRPPKQNGALWIRHLTVGIALIIIALGWWWAGPSHGGPSAFIAFVLFGVGVASVIRAWLNRKYQPLSKAMGNKNRLAVSPSEPLQQTEE